MPRTSPRDGRDQREMNRSGDVCRSMRGLGVHPLAGVFVQSLAHARRAPLRPCASPWLGGLGGQSLMHSADVPGLEALRCLASLPTGDLAEAGESRWGGRGGDSYRRAPWVRPRSGARGGPSPGPFRITDQPLDEALGAGPAYPPPKAMVRSLNRRCSGVAPADSAPAYTEVINAAVIPVSRSLPSRVITRCVVGSSRRCPRIMLAPSSELPSGCRLLE